MKPSRSLAALLIVALCLPSVWSQSATPAASATPAVSALPEPYTSDEFPSWAAGLRRFEIISLGAFPILLFYTRFGLDLKRYAEHGFDAEYAPWPFKNENSYAVTDDEQMISIATAAGLSLTFGALDAFFLWKKTFD